MSTDMYTITRPFHIVRRVTFAIGGVAAVVMMTAQGLAQGATSPDERVAALIASLKENQTRLTRYEWIETTIISLKGEEKARKQQRCYYGADGKVQKLPIESAAPPQAPSGGRGGRGGRLKERIVENKKDEIQDYMAAAGQLIQQYLPPNPAQIQAAKAAGNVAVKPLDAKSVQLAFSNYLQKGDSMAILIDAAANQLVGLALTTYLEKPEDVVTLDVHFGSLTDGTRHVAQTVLDAKAKNIRVVVENTGYRPVSR